MGFASSDRSGRLPRGSWSTLLVWGSIALLVAAATTITVYQMAAMSGSMSLVSGNMGLSLPLFLLLWIPMMAAMMLPAAAPLLVLAARMLATGPHAAIAVGQLIAGYLGVWALAGIPAYLILLGSGTLIEQAPGVAPWVSAALLIAAGIYQWMPLKRLCLGQCRSPFAFLMQTAQMRGPFRGLRIGVRHGWLCLGCCWALMLALLALGLMNVALMAGFAICIFIEKIWRYGATFARAVGVALVLLGLIVLLHPEIAPGLSPAGM